MMRALEMDHSIQKAEELMKEIDEDGSGQLDFGEFCALLAKVKRGDVELHGFAKLTQDIGATPVAVLNLEVVKRSLKSLYRFVETREATAMYDKYEVMEVVLSGHWSGAAREVRGPRGASSLGTRSSRASRGSPTASGPSRASARPRARPSRPRPRPR